MTTRLHRGDLPDVSRYGREVAIDTETMGLDPRRDRLCVVQLSPGDGSADVVQIPQDLREAPNLVSLLTDPGRTKIFHYARFDIAVLKHRFGVVTGPVWCTKIASKLVRTYTDRHGLKDLARELLNVDMNKQQQSSDWGADKITDQQLDYAASDVLYLHDIKRHLDRMLRREGRLELAETCFRFLPARIELDLLGWDEEDIFAHSWMTLARTDTFDQRSTILHSLTARNRVIGVLRLVVPAAGVAAFVVLAAEIYTTNTLRQYGVSGIRIDRGALVIDTPQYSAIGANGAHYTASAKEARAPLANTHVIAMEAAVLTLEQPGRPTMRLNAPIANADTEKQLFTVPGTASLTDSAGLHGTLAQLEADVSSGIIVAKGPVAMAFRNGATLSAADMRYDSTAQLLTLERVTFTAPALPEASP